MRHTQQGLAFRAKRADSGGTLFLKVRISHGQHLVNDQDRGIDVNRDRFSDELDPIATSMRRERDALFDRALVLARVLEGVEEEVDRFVAHGPSAIVDRIEARLAFTGERARCDDHVGIVLGLAPSGALSMRLDDGTVREIVSGTLRRA